MVSERPRPLVAGNWKMNGLRGSVRVAEEVRAGYSADLSAAVDLLVCPPATLIHPVALALEGSSISIGGQDAHHEPSGAYTGNVSAEMLADLGATHVILGHSERRSMHRESNAEVKAKASGSRRAGLVPIICVGETREERDAGRAIEIVVGQVGGSLPEGSSGANIIVAYEPVWAIGTGLVPTSEDVAAMHAAIRGELVGILGQTEAASVRILYGGSVKPGNARELLAVSDVDGALVGGASLVAHDFLAIASAYLPEPS